jgi:hypothetical protein
MRLLPHPTHAPRGSRLWLSLALGLPLAACSDYSLEAEGKTEPGGEDSAPPADTGEPPGGDGGEDPPPDEVCNGEDDDGDGLVDEDFPDVDGDGQADCVDRDCAVDPAPARSELDEACTGGEFGGTPPVDPWSWTIEWQWRGGNVYSTPAVGDLDGDGVPEIVFTHDGYGSSLQVLDGASGAEVWSVPGIDNQSGVALGDVDLDGSPEIIATTGSCFTAHTVQAYSASGALEWSTAIGTACETYPAIADLEGDGDVEIVVNDYILDGATGAVVARLAISGADNWGAPALADMDGDGVMEVLLENRVYRADGSLVYACGAGGTGTFPHPVDIDGDPQGELLVAAPSRITLCDHTGAALWSRPHSSYGSAIAVADFDNDGQQEFAFANYGTVTLLERDGSTRWATPIADYSGLAGATSWDIDLDGVPEVVYADENDILVLNGATGAVVLREASHGSVTLAETPAVADVDGDGSGELLYGSNSSLRGLTVVGSADGDWPYARPVYNQYSYYGDNIEDDLTVPLNPDPPWLSAANLFRGQPSAVYVLGAPDLAGEITDVCVSACEDEGIVRVAAVVWNRGTSEVPAGVLVHLETDVDGLPARLAEATLAAPLLPGASASLEFETVAGAVAGGLRLSVDAGAAVDECVETDNLATWAGDWPCAAG